MIAEGENWKGKEREDGGRERMGRKERSVETSMVAIIALPRPSVALMGHHWP